MAVKHLFRECTKNPRRRSLCSSAAAEGRPAGVAKGAQCAPFAAPASLSRRRQPVFHTLCSRTQGPPRVSRVYCTINGTDWSSSALAVVQAARLAGHKAMIIMCLMVGALPLLRQWFPNTSQTRKGAQTGGAHPATERERERERELNRAYDCVAMASTRHPPSCSTSVKTRTSNPPPG